MSLRISLSYSDIIRAIDELDLYEEDYKVIQDLLGADPRLFVKILEEVILGGLYFSDFKRIFSSEEYSDLLESNFSNQEKIYKEIERYITLKEKLQNEATKIENISEQYSARSSEDDYFTKEKGKIYNNIGLMPNYNEYDPLTGEYGKALNNLYDSEYAENRKDMFFQLFGDSENDSLLVKAAKLKLYNAINAFNKIYIKNADGDYTIENKNAFSSTIDSSVLEQGEITSVYLKYENDLFNAINDAYSKMTKFAFPGESTSRVPTEDDLKKYAPRRIEVINPDDILFYVKDAILPINYRHQVLTVDDRSFMAENKIDETTMKKMKAYAMFIKKENVIEELEKSNKTI